MKGSLELNVGSSVTFVEHRTWFLQVILRITTVFLADYEKLRMVDFKGKTLVSEI
jgi:hypothetical protein